MYPDLIARTCGYLGVFSALIGMGIWGEPEFAVTPQQSFDSVRLSLQVLESPAPQSTEALEQKVTTPEEPEAPQEPEVEEAEPEPVEAVVPEKPAPQEPDNPPEVEPIKAPEPQPVVEPKQTIKEERKAPERKATPVKEEEKAKPASKPKPKAAPSQPRAKSAGPKSEKAAPSAAQGTARPEGAAASSAADSAAAAQVRSQLSSILVREICSHLQYPRNAVRRKLEGTVMMEFEVKDGVVVDFTLRRSSGHKILDEAARKLAEKLVQFNTRLKAMSYRVQIPIKYELL